MSGNSVEHLCHPSQVGGVSHLLVEGDDEDDEQVPEEADEDDDGEKDGHCRAENCCSLHDL